jgi:Ca-activated chloride channel homolog
MKLLRYLRRSSLLTYSVALAAALACSSTLAQEAPPAPSPLTQASQPSAPEPRAPETRQPEVELGTGDVSPPQAEYETPDPRFARWLKDVDPLILGPERLAFHKLRTDYQRDAFIQQFWRSRDPFPETARNELRDRWERNIELARSLYGSLEDDRARILLIHGEPGSSFEVRCTTTRKPAEVWFYERSPMVNFPFLLVFLRERGLGPGRVWRPGALSADLLLESSRSCINGEQLQNAVSFIRSSGDYDLSLRSILAKPRPRSSEWLANFVSFTTDLPRNAEIFPAELDMAFLGRYQSRTVTQGLLRVPVEEASLGELAGYRSYDFQITGEIVSPKGLFESFRYKFGFPVEAKGALGLDGGEIPLAFRRYLRPGDYTMVLKVEDLNSGRFFRREQPLEVPRMDEAVTTPLREDPESSALFADATEAMAGDGTSIRIVPPRLELLTGFVRFDTFAVGDDIERVVFTLDGRELMTKNRPPYNVEIDLGPLPRIHTLQVAALDGEGREVAADNLLVNSGGNRFRVRLTEPRKGKTYDSSLLARAEVEVPEGRSLERLEVYLNERLMATLYQEPFAQPIALSSSSELTFVRAVAYLDDGNSTEDIVFINAPENLEEVDVQLVELYATVLNRGGRPIQGLGRDDFTVEEDGKRQTLARFDAVGDLPIHVGILLDNSGSMRGSLNQARGAALRFFQQVLTPKDRAAVITFNRLPTLAVKLTSDLQQLAGGLAGLTAEGDTALYDSVMFGLYYFTGIKGQRAILLLSDGRDEGSRFSFDETLEYARRAGVTIYSIGLDLEDSSARAAMKQLADETGGRSFFTSRADELEQIYDLIQGELRSQYLLAYQSSNTGEGDAFRSLDVKVDVPGAEVKTISGYYP